MRGKKKEWFSCDIAREEGVVPYLRGGLEMLDILPNTHHLACVCELLLDCLEGGYGAGPVALAKQVVREEAGEVLQGPQGFVTASCGGFLSELSQCRGGAGSYRSRKRSGCSGPRSGGRRENRQPCWRFDCAWWLVIVDCVCVWRGRLCGSWGCPLN